MSVAAAAKLEYRILGPLEVARDAVVLPEVGERQRTLLAVLLLHANEVVSSDRLIDELFGEDAGASAVNTLQAAVSRLRKFLAPSDALVTRPRGYMLRVGDDELDLLRFERLVADARRALGDGDADRAATLLRRALALWRGEPLADVALPSSEAEIVRLNELRLGAVMDRIDADLALGRHAVVVGELEALVREHPYQERLRGQLMLALYRCGRQADALAAYRAARELLVDELGIEPSRPLQGLEQRILRQDATLEPAPAEPWVAPRPEVLRPPFSRPQRAPISIAVAALVAFAAVGVALAVRRGAEAGAALPSRSVVAINPENAKVVDSVSVGSEPTGLAVTRDAVWVAAAAESTLIRIDPSTRRITRRIGLGLAPDVIAADRGTVWIADRTTRSLGRIDLASGHVVETIPQRTGPRVGALELTPRDVWVAYDDADEVVRFDRSTRRLEAHVGGLFPGFVPGSAPVAVAVADGAVWVAHTVRSAAPPIDVGYAARIDPATNAPVAAVRLPNRPTAIAAAANAVWVAVTGVDSVWHIDPATNSLRRTVRVGEDPTSLAVAADGSVWVANTKSESLSKIDPRTDEVVDEVKLGRHPEALAVAGDTVWVALGDSS
jgi:YVTN family beta-propeller protein